MAAAKGHPLQAPGRSSEPILADLERRRREKSKAHANESAREFAARALAEKRQKAGDPVLQFDANLWRRYLEFQAIVGGDVDPLIVAHEWRASKQGRPASLGMPVAEGVKRYFALRDQERSWGDSAKRHARKHLERFTTQYGRRRMNEVSAEDVRVWLFGKADGNGDVVGQLRDDEGNFIGAHGVIDHLKSVRTFFTYALREGWGDTVEPLRTHQGALHG